MFLGRGVGWGMLGLGMFGVSAREGRVTSFPVISPVYLSETKLN